MLELTKQERLVLIFLMGSGILGIGILCYKNLAYQPKIEIVSSPAAEQEIAEGRIVNINTAKKEELMRLKGIGPSLAEAIIEYRAAHGGFKTKDELKEIKGIGQAKYDGIKENIKVE